MIVYKITFLTFFICLTSVFAQTKLELGKYKVHIPTHTYQEITLFRDSTFIRNESGCLGETNDKGKWKIQADTLIAISTLREKTKGGEKKFYPVNELQCCTINKYLITKDAFLYIDKSINGESFYLADTLKKNWPRVKGHRQKY